MCCRECSCYYYYGLKLAFYGGIGLAIFEESISNPEYGDYFYILLNFYILYFLRGRRIIFNIWLFFTLFDIIFSILPHSNIDPTIKAIMFIIIVGYWLSRIFKRSINKFLKNKKELRDDIQKTAY